MFRFLLNNIYLLFAAFILSSFFPKGSIAQTTIINPIIWNDNITASATPSGFAILPATTTPGVPAVTVSEWQRNGPLGDGTGGSFNSNNWTVGGTFAAAEANYTYVSFAISNNATTELYVDSFYIYSQVSATGPEMVQLAYAVGSGPNTTFGSAFGTAHMASPEYWPITGRACIAPGQTDTFKLYGYAATGSGGTLRINNLTAMVAYYTTVSSALTVTATNSSPVCVGTLLNFTGGATGGFHADTYSWLGPLSYTSTLEDASLSSVPLGAAGTYTLTVTDSLGCTAEATSVVTVNSAPSAISGIDSVCVGRTITLSDGGGGTWSSSTTSAATVNSATGIVTGVSPGTTTITYTLSGSCTTSVVITINPMPSAISGTFSICAGFTTALSDGGGGVWTSSTTAVATITPGSGVVAGISGGTSNITYTISAGGCFVTALETINSSPSAIGGLSAVCVGATTALTDGGGGSWSSSNTAIATVGTGTGIVTGITPGTTTITYTLSAGCTATLMMTVNPLPSSISGIATVCVGLTTALSDGGGGTWISSNMTVATVVSGSGMVTGVSAGTAIITYTISTGCFVTAEVSVNPLPSVIAGAATVCYGATVSLSDGGGGSWSSSNTAVVTVGTGTGVISGVSVGTSVIIYTLPTGCITSTVVTTNPLPSAIAGIASVCAGLTTTVSDGGGGTWSSSNTFVATTITGSGIVTGITGGTSIITYTLPVTGCLTTTVATVNPLPFVISGPGNVCAGVTVSLIDPGGGIWSSGDLAIATIGTASGVVTGVAVGSTLITYTLSTGCTATTPINVYGLPTAIIGVSPVCAGRSLVLIDSTAGGVWSSSATSVATVGSLSGLVIGLTNGTSTITYTQTGTGCLITDTVTVNPLPLAIVGSAFLCTGSTTLLSDAGSGSWSSSNTAVATAGSTGVITGITTGSAIITYTLPTGCIAIDTMTVIGSPAVIAGTTHLCIGQATILRDASSGGTWTSSNTDVFADVSSGEITGIFSGTSTITYALTGCRASVIVTVNPLPPLISGVLEVCPGSIASLSDGGGGTWSSSNTTVATVITSTGVVTGIIAGTSSVTYTLGTGCATNTTITVNPLPSAITGIASVCVGSTTLLSDGGSGTWSSSNTALATIISSATGIIAGASPGTSIITYTLGTGCATTTTIMVDSLPSFIAGASSVCVGSTTDLHDAGGGAWSSDNTAIATIATATGLVTGILSGTAIITYELPVTGCATAATITVDPLPSAISGATGLCIGSMSLLSDAGGGTWVSGNASVATVVPGSGSVSGVSAGSAIITYTLSTGCQATVSLTVNSFPSLIEGAYVLCVGTTSGLIDAGGGAWSSGNTLVATINLTTGIVTGVSTGSAIITYALGTGCTTTAVLTVDPLPSPVTGTFSVCAGSTTTLIDGGGGVWSSANTAVATVVPGTGVVIGITADTVSITYSLPGGCVITKLVTVNPLPLAITGNPSICLGSTVTLSDAGGGTWSSSNTAKATVVAGTGVVTGVSAGTSTVTYKISTGCITETTVTVNPLPGTISGATSACLGTTTVLTDGGVGTWSSSNTAIATIGYATGIVGGVSAGTTAITFTNSFGCIATALFTVNPLPSAIGGSPSACIGAATDLYDLSRSGTWVSSNTTIATVVPGTGVVTGVSAGTTNITFTLDSTGCRNTTFVTIISLPTSIAGTTHICVGSSTSLSDAGGGSWTSSDTSAATIGSGSGTVTGVSSGTSIITYAVGTGCFVTVIVTANPLPSPVTGGLAICAGTTTALGDLTTGGVWTSSSTSTATVTSGRGDVSGLSAGTSVISYTLATGCGASAILTVNSLPSVVSGLSSVCVGSSITLTNTTSGGLWISSNTAVASVNAVSGSVAGIVPGTSVITYSLGSGCTASKTVSVMPLPLGITGTIGICQGSTTALASATTAGTWASSNTTIASVIVPTTGNISGLSVGTAAVTYTISTGCRINTIVTVNPNPSAISGLSVICAGSTTALGDSGGGTWSSIPVTTATVGTLTGIVTGLTSGTAIITYRLSTGCNASAIITVNPSPSSISGVTNICFGTTVAFTDTAFGGTWSSALTAVATVSTAGVVTGVSPGTAIISFNNASGCAATKMVTINPLPINITGLPHACIGTITDLSDSSTGGTWSSSDTSIAVIGSLTGEIAGIALGSVTITYTLPTGCSTTRAISVLPTPSAIPSVPAVCVGSTVALTDTTSGGVWSSAVLSIATVGSATGVVIGSSSGTVIISYIIPATGCSAVTSVIVNALSPIVGDSIVCAGQVTVLADTTADGVWTSSAPAFATAVTATFTTGFVSGVSAGTATIIYTLPTGCAATKIVTVNLAPPAISGLTQVCAGSTTTLVNAATGGTWSSSDLSVASVSTIGGVVLGNAVGSATITYTVSGCSVTAIFTVDPLPAAVTGTTEICAGTTAVLTDLAVGTWGSSSFAVATVSGATGVVYGVSAGTSAITYTLPTGCTSMALMTVDPLPRTVAGVTNVCTGSTTALTDAGGGAWSNSSSAILSVDPISGVVSGISSGTSIITYSLSTGCFTTVAVTVNPLPEVISGPGNVCPGSDITLSDASGGTWISSSLGIATIAFFTGIITGVSPGTTTVTYTLGTGCAISAVITVNPLPASITGVYTVCSSMPAVLSDAVTGGVWNSGNTAVATIASVTGNYTGVSGGTATITYTAGCPVTTTVTVIPMPAEILGPTNICLGQPYILSDAVTGGTWSSLSPSTAYINPVSGIVTGATIGVTTIFYTTGGVCTSSVVVTVLPIPAVYSVTGGDSYCAGGAGVHIGLTGSATGFNYLLYLGATATGTFAGTGAALDFGLQAAAGTYTVISINTTTGCTNAMAGSASIVVTPTVRPLVSINASPAEALCSGASATFTPVPVNGGLTPSYQWKINGVSVSSGNTYTYIPADSDAVSVTLTSDATCPYPATATGLVTMTVLSPQMPAVGVAANPGDTICQGSAVMLSALPTYGGTSPAYIWVINGIHAGSGRVYSYVPLNGDIVYCTMTSNYICRLANTATSGSITLAVDTPMLPLVAINANPGTSINIGESDTLTAVVTNGGSSPAYQWSLNGLPVAGATTNTYISTNFNYPHEDSVACAVTSSGGCDMTSFQWVYVSVHPLGIQTVPTNATEVSVLPNPNTGEFAIKGTLGNAIGTDEEVSLEMTDMLGQVVYKTTLTTYNGKLDRQIQLSNALANGMYIFNLVSASKNIVFHIVVER